MRRIVVGLDGSDRSVQALAWAVRLANGTGAKLEVVTVAAELVLAEPFGVAWDTAGSALSQATAAHKHGLDQVDLGGLDVTSTVQVGQPAGVLIGCADDADLLVVGTHGYGTLEAALLGSVGRQVITHATCPVVLVPEDSGQLRRFVVGVDGSEEATHALRWAAELARQVEAELEVVTVFHHTPVGIGSPWVAPIPDVGERELREAATTVLDRSVEQAGAADVVVERTVSEGSAAARLRDRALDADLLVVGSRGHGGFAGLLLGSVSRRCLTHAPRPVAVIRSG